LADASGIDQFNTVLVSIMNRTPLLSCVLGLPEFHGSMKRLHLRPGSVDLQMHFANRARELGRQIWQANGRLGAILFMSREKRGPTNRTMLRVASRLFLAFLLGLWLAMAGGSVVQAQEAGSEPAEKAPAANQALLSIWEGKQVLRIEFAGVSAARLAPVPDQLAQRTGAPLRGENIRQSLRRLYATRWQTAAIISRSLRIR
jgi:hypothetical protein